MFLITLWFRNAGPSSGVRFCVISWGESILMRRFSVADQGRYNKENYTGQLIISGLSTWFVKSFLIGPMCVRFCKAGV